VASDEGRGGLLLLALTIAALTVLAVFLLVLFLSWEGPREFGAASRLPAAPRIL
jgi:hypothetical protein